jgi:hypothetical protein
MASTSRRAISAKRRLFRQHRPTGDIGSSIAVTGKVEDGEFLAVAGALEHLRMA